ncbi:hypothetical protein PC119_g25924 [Phytophthora cactorum]|uniref:Uncharacterized protein n=1 Tax=Phytophthora cactorum TaxID=29920 RepID=A0A8T1AJK1_9STRA|nr:hypothetical protein PC117_g26169 [Phytophthora cactorum]KAG2962068.1 hypothetical protein PC119_g25924 [Phytophthora cactorum]KAG3131280.1 hypothetical protein C6341_g23397 [Phytophthora cactorum]KAG3157005.1 hypothetical protein PC128_g21736 [Phytophthora cactorum]
MMGGESGKFSAAAAHERQGAHGPLPEGEGTGTVDALEVLLALYGCRGKIAAGTVCQREKVCCPELPDESGW